MSLTTIIDSCERAKLRTAYRLKHACEKRARNNNHLTFLLRCRKNHLIPNGLQVKLPVQSQKSDRIVQRTSEALCRERIAEARATKVRIERRIDTLRCQLTNSLDEEQWKQLDTLCNCAEQKTFTTTKTRQQQKFQCLQQTHFQSDNMTPRNTAKPVINLSSRTLNPTELQVLALGLNYVISPPLYL